MAFHYQLATNDPKLPLIKLTLSADIKPVPAFVRRLEAPNLINGDWSDAFKVWPTAHPQMFLEVGEAISFSLRVWPDKSHTRPLIVDSEHLGVDRSANNGNGNGFPKAVGPVPPVTVKTRRDPAHNDVYWLDVSVGPADHAGTFQVVMVVPPGEADLAELKHLDLTVTVVESSVTVYPPAVTPPAVSIESLGPGNEAVQVGIFSLRKLFGTFHLLSATIDSPMLSATPQTIVKDKNFLIKVSLKSKQGLKPGTIESSVLIKTDDPKHAEIRVPVKIVFVP